MPRTSPDGWLTSWLSPETALCTEPFWLVVRLLRGCMSWLHFDFGRRAFGIAAGLALPLTLGCAASPKTESAPALAPASVPAEPGRTNAEVASPESEPQTLADAEALLEKARSELETLALNQPERPASAAAGAPSPAPAPQRREDGRADKAAADDAAPPSGAATDPCQTACKAFSSLARAAEAVCRLDAEDGKRCARARQIRQDASQRVASCGCLK